MLIVKLPRVEPELHRGHTVHGRLLELSPYLQLLVLTSGQEHEGRDGDPDITLSLQMFTQKLGCDKGRQNNSSAADDGKHDESWVTL